MAEDIILNAAVLVDTGATKFRVTQLHLDWESQKIGIRLREVNANGVAAQGGRVVHASYGGAMAITLMTALNKANLSTKSLHKRIIEQLQADGRLGAGTINGSPD